MEASLEGGRTDARVEFDVVEGSHVYIRRDAEGVDVFREWSDIPEDARQRYLSIAEKIETAIEEASSMASQDVFLRPHEIA